MSQCLVIKYTLLLWAYAAVCNVQQSSCTLGGSYSFLLQLIFPLFTARAAQTQKCFALEWLPHAHFNVHIYLLSITCRVFFWFVFTVSHLLPFQRKTKKETIPLTAIAPCTAVGFIGAIRREGQTLRLLLTPSLPPSLLSDSHHIPQLLPPPSHSPDPLPSAVAVWLRPRPSFLPCEPHVSVCVHVCYLSWQEGFIKCSGLGYQMISICPFAIFVQQCKIESPSSQCSILMESPIPWN